MAVQSHLSSFVQSRTFYLFSHSFCDLFSVGPMQSCRCTCLEEFNQMVVIMWIHPFLFFSFYIIKQCIINIKTSQQTHCTNVKTCTYCIHYHTGKHINNTHTLARARLNTQAIDLSLAGGLKDELLHFKLSESNLLKQLAKTRESRDCAAVCMLLCVAFEIDLKVQRAKSYNLTKVEWVRF